MLSWTEKLNFSQNNQNQEAVKIQHGKKIIADIRCSENEVYAM